MKGLIFPIALFGIVVVIGIYVVYGPAWSFLSSAAEDVARFMPLNSIDVAMAMGLVSHDPPIITHLPPDVGDMLVYPPTAADLERLSG